MTHPKQFCITAIDRFKRSIKFLRHLSFLFLVGISTYKAPVFAQGTIQEAPWRSKIHLRVFVSSAVLNKAIEEAAPTIKSDTTEVELLGLPAMVTSKVKLNEIKLYREDGKIGIAAKLSGSAEISYKRDRKSTGHARLKGEVKLLVGHKAQKNESIEIKVTNIDDSVKFSKAVTSVGSEKINVKSHMETKVKQHIKNEMKKLNKYFRKSLETYVRRTSSALNAFIEGLSNDALIRLFTTPRTVVTTTTWPPAPRGGFSLHLSAEAETDQARATPKRNTPSIQLAPSLRVVAAPPSWYLKLPISTKIDFKTINKLIKKKLKSYPILKKIDHYTFEFEEITFTPTEHVQPTDRGKVTVKVRLSSDLHELSGHFVDQRVRTIEFQAKPILSRDRKKIDLNNVHIKGKNIEHLGELLMHGGSLSKEQIEELFKNIPNIYLNSIFEEKLQNKIIETSGKKDIEVAVRVSSLTNMKTISVDKISFQVNANVFIMLELKVIKFDDFSTLTL